MYLDFIGNDIACVEGNGNVNPIIADRKIKIYLMYFLNI